MEIIELLKSQLKINEDQASGGLGILMKLAKEKLDGGDFAKVAEVIPGTEGLISKAPEAGGLMKSVGGLTSMLGGKAEGLGALAGLASSFKQLNLEGSIISKFTGVVMNFIQEKGGAQLKGLLGSVLGNKS